jgi:hypothetical protein
MNGAKFQKPNPPFNMPIILLSNENIENEKITNPAIRRTTGTRCDTKERLAWHFTSRSSVSNLMMPGRSKGEKKTLK